jgi:hypothetical protein
MMVPPTLLAIFGATGAAGGGFELQPASNAAANRKGKIVLRMRYLREAAIARLRDNGRILRKVRITTKAPRQRIREPVILFLPAREIKQGRKGDIASRGSANKEIDSAVKYLLRCASLLAPPTGGELARAGILALFGMTGEPLLASMACRRFDRLSANRPIELWS